MSPEFLEGWLAKGLSLPKFILRAVGAVGLVVTVIALVKYLRGLEYGADVALGFFFVTIWAVSEMVRVKFVHTRYVRANPGATAGISSKSEPVRTNPTPGHMGFASAGHGIVLNPDSKPHRVKFMHNRPTWGGWQAGDLPAHVTSEGPSGDRDMQTSAPHDDWVWDYENVTFVNESEEHLTFHVWLVVKTTDKVGLGN